MSSSALAASAQKDEEYKSIIASHVGHELESTNFDLGQRKVGKVRDMYILPEQVVLVTTDRVSAFDRNLAVIPFKGQVLNLTSLWWFNKTAHIVPNHILARPDPSAVVCKPCTVFPVEFVVRGFIAGSTDTSMWVNYNKGMRDYCGHVLPEGLVRNQRLEKNIVTPTTKDDAHDELTSGKEIVAQGKMTQEEWDFCHDRALELFAFGQATALEHGFLLVDTKYEFGKDGSGNILIVDEIHTPDSSRYWIAATYEERQSSKQEPESVDKDILRNWYKANCDPYKDVDLPAAPRELVIELSRRYIGLYEAITGERFAFPSDVVAPATRLETALRKALIQ